MTAGRPQTPYAIAEATGRTTINPGRYGTRAMVSLSLPPLGDPPAAFGWLERAKWAQIAATAWWLDEGDRHMLAAACRVGAMVEATDGAPVDMAVYNTYARLLGNLGLSATSRVKVLQERAAGRGDDYDDDL